ncbi:WhiB family transcriptional regulator [Prescottella equi]|uniref:WhiB family transcriptional regulator n=1 Tax=Rhodococcus hoagii TaxID=43767 RepID=UPI00301CAE86
MHLPAPLAEPWDWQLAADCRDADPMMFFHPDNERGESRESRVRAAKRICLSCPVRVRCLNYALEAREHHGIWGGYTEDERRALRLQRLHENGARAASDTCDGSAQGGWTNRWSGANSADASQKQSGEDKR